MYLFILSRIRDESCLIMKRHLFLKTCYCKQRERYEKSQSSKRKIKDPLNHLMHCTVNVQVIPARSDSTLFRAVIIVLSKSVSVSAL